MFTDDKADFRTFRDHKRIAPQTAFDGRQPQFAERGVLMRTRAAFTRTHSQNAIAKPDWTPEAVDSATDCLRSFSSKLPLKTGVENRRSLEIPVAAQVPIWLHYQRPSEVVVFV